MCLSVPARVTELLEDHHARVEIGGITKEISAFLIDDLKVGDYVLIHVGHALTKIDDEEARKTLELFKEIYSAEELR